VMVPVMTVLHSVAACALPLATSPTTAVKPNNERLTVFMLRTSCFCG